MEKKLCFKKSENLGNRDDQYKKMNKK